jgi:hypothetical protein
MRFLVIGNTSKLCSRQKFIQLLTQGVTVERYYCQFDNRTTTNNQEIYLQRNKFWRFCCVTVTRQHEKNEKKIIYFILLRQRP